MRKSLLTLIGAALAAQGFSQALTVPYETSLYQDAAWTIRNINPDSKTWEYSNDYFDFRGSGYEEGVLYSYDRQYAADDWLISPAVHLEAGKEYKVYFRGVAYSDLEKYSLSMAGDTTVVSLSAPEALLYDYDGATTDWNKVSRVVKPAATGDFYFAFHAYSDADRNGIVLTGFGVKENVFVPAPATGLMIVPDADGALTASVSWTLPSVDSDGAPFPENVVFDNVEVWRDGKLVTTLAGAATQWTDTEADGLVAGRHTYGVYVTVNGVKSAVVEAESPYIGPAVVYDVPWTVNMSSLDELSFSEMFTVIKGEKSTVSSSYGWEFRSGYVRFYPRSYSKREDDWLVMPKVKFAKPGVYRVLVNAKYSETGVAPLFDVMMGSGKTIEALTEKLGSITSIPTSAGDVYVAFEVKEPCEAYIALHACREEAGSAKEIDFYSFTIDEAQILPSAVADLAVAVDGGSVVLSWTNPAVNNVGQPLEGLTKTEVLRDGVVIATVTEPLAAGAAVTYTDTPAEGGVYSYSVIPYMGDAVPEGKPMVVKTGWVGDILRQLPYDLNFSDAPSTDEVSALWLIENRNEDSYKWSVGSNAFTLRLNSEGGFNDDALLTPPFNLEPGDYDVLVRAKGAEEGFPVRLGVRYDDADAVSPEPVKAFELNGNNSYADYSAVLTVPAKGRGRIEISTDPAYEHDYDPYSLMVQRVKISRSENSTGVESVETAAEGAAVYYDLNGLRVANPVKGAVYVVRTADGKVKKQVMR